MTVTNVTDLADAPDATVYSVALGDDTWDCYTDVAPITPDASDTPGVLNTIYEGPWADRPAAASVPVGSEIIVSDVPTNSRSRWWNDGTYWRPLNGAVILALQEGDVTHTGNATETLLLQGTLAAGMVPTKGRIRLMLGFGKDNTAETATVRVRFGPLGTAADPIVAGSAALAGATISLGMNILLQRVNSTGIRKVGDGDAAALDSLGSASTTAAAGTATTGDFDAVTNYVTITGQLSVGAETMALHGTTMELMA